MNGGTPYLVPWPAMQLPLHTQLGGQLGQMGGQLAGQLGGQLTAQLPGQVGKLTGLQLQQLQQLQQQAQIPLTHFPQFMALAQQGVPPTAVTAAGAGMQQMYPLSALSLPPSILSHNNLVTSLPKFILPGVKVKLPTRIIFIGHTVKLTLRKG